MNTFEADSEVMRWTVVGITTSISSTTTPFFMAPQSSSLATTVSPSLVNASKISSKNTEETLPVTSPLLLSSIHSAQPSLLSKTTDNTNQSNCLLSAFPGISSLVNSDIQSQVPSEWRVVGISPIVSAPNALSNLTQLKPDQLLQLPTNSLASESDLITTSATVSTTTIYTSTVQSQIPTLGSSSGSEVINTYTQVTQPMPMRPSAWQDPAKRLARSPNILPLTVPITSPGSNEKPYVGDPLHVLNHDHHILSCATSSKLQDGLKDVDFVPLKEAQNSNWKVVGVVANNQVSMLSSDQRCEDNDFDRDSRYLEPFTMTALSNPSIPLPVLPSEGKDPIRVQKLQSDRNFQYVSMENRREDHENSSTLQMTPKDHESCPYKRKQFDWNRRAKDMLKKPSSKLKKNTVSNLLKMRRCQSSGPEHPDIHSGQEFHEENHLRFTDDSPRKRCRSRSLRSYSGNRHEFQGSPDGRDSAFHLRSSSDTTVSDHNSEDETERNQLVKMEKLSPPVSPVTSSDKHTEETSSHSFSKSPARRRKLKVPRKMVADLDYHPFDSSSDSN
ncbi:hypothetical protein RRG08_034609 [Elysia crispata]|nr:hypothetical protein RRG08_034609 [Elysia crispata]